jgi:hypothetical protein
MRRFLIGLLGMILGFPVAAFGGYWAIELFSDNHFDRNVEASMTALFVMGPAGAVIGFLAGLILGKPRHPARPDRSPSAVP